MLNPTTHPTPPQDCPCRWCAAMRRNEARQLARLADQERRLQQRATERRQDDGRQ